ncbi:16S rRNA methyltransferase [Loktanella sp. 5RATIMAR09]|uniref:16S rRNA (guanine(527)-N(7))-methyltransferase RsmG n=1 Tax=Loktanella sp. 5RATIMAR09 TaxID=1225655 RepID=UPI0006EB6BC8|nr:16S rRNA (guanine(527)-N(7))-methyltransferase RsmG [Loktanella sp. 5RATIMAR09]KQI73578.1 16S rRNA methyltransferase [Loktanella sp. 5RATIMAR09]
MSQVVAGVNVSRETMSDLEAFATLTAKWTAKINLIARGTVDSIWDRHIADSVQLYKFAPQNFEKWVDIGSGGGFPGIVMAIVAKEKHPQAQFVLIESDQRKATFLRTAARELNLPVQVIAERIETAPVQNADVVSARALTALSGLLSLTQRHLNQEGLALFHKGRQSGQEVADAQMIWSFDLEENASITDPDARILAIRRIDTLGS